MKEQVKAILLAGAFQVYAQAKPGGQLIEKDYKELEERAKRVYKQSVEAFEKWPDPKVVMEKKPAPKAVKT